MKKKKANPDIQTYWDFMNYKSKQTQGIMWYSPIESNSWTWGINFEYQRVIFLLSWFSIMFQTDGMLIFRQMRHACIFKKPHQNENLYITSFFKKTKSMALLPISVLPTLKNVGISFKFNQAHPYGFTS